VLVVVAKVLKIGPFHEFVKVIAFMFALLIHLLNIQDNLQQVVGFHILDAKDPQALATADDCHDTL
jgi:hypothetical protein